MRHVRVYRLGPEIAILGGIERPDSLYPSRGLMERESNLVAWWLGSDRSWKGGSAGCGDRAVANVGGNLALTDSPGMWDVGWGRELGWACANVLLVMEPQIEPTSLGESGNGSSQLAACNLQPETFCSSKDFVFLTRR